MISTKWNDLFGSTHCCDDSNSKFFCELIFSSDHEACASQNEDLQQLYVTFCTLKYSHYWNDCVICKQLYKKMNSTESTVTAAENIMENIANAGDKDEDEDEEEMDKELEKVAATFILQPSSIQPAQATQNDSIIKPHRESLLTFQFPGWGIDIRKGAAVSRHVGNTADDPSSSLQSAKKCFGAADKPGIGTSVYRIPNEMWMHILRFLNAKELCSLRQTCRWFYFLASHDDAWDDMHQHDCKVEEERLLQAPLPRWIKVKSSILDSQIKQKLSYFSKGYDYLRAALNSWWNVGGPDPHYRSKSLQSLINKMTAREWPVVYDAFAVVFSERVDILANYLLTEFESGAACNVDAYLLKKGGSPLCYQLCMEDKHSSTRKSLSSTEDGLLGKEMWQFVQESWVRYKRWLSLVSTHCQYLNYQVMAERARSTIWISTPTVYDKGIICFRNQILLRYRIRKYLQCGLSWLIRQDALDIATENDTCLLNAILHLLQEVDVADDLTLSSKMHTRTKLERCFLLNGVTSKVVR